MKKPMKPEPKAIDFERRFQRFALDWIKRHPGLKEDEIDERYNDMLAEWRGTPADWLGGETPAGYFEKFDDAEGLAALLPVYDEAGVELPEALYSRVASLGEAAVPALLALAGNADLSANVRGTALSLLNDIGSPQALPLCADILADIGEMDETAEGAVRLLARGGRACVPLLLERYDRATGAGKEAILDVLCNFPGEPRVYELAAYRFLNVPEKRAMHADFLARLGDERALEPLQLVAKAADLTYYDYLEIVNAIEALGGTLDSAREFYGDPDYEAMRFLD